MTREMAIYNFLLVAGTQNTAGVAAGMTITMAKALATLATLREKGAATSVGFRPMYWTAVPGVTLTDGRGHHPASAEGLATSSKRQGKRQGGEPIPSLGPHILDTVWRETYFPIAEPE
jgi:hypothetical protein